FKNCVSLLDIKFSDTITVIESSAFQNAGLVSLILPESVTTIGECAFDGCINLAKVTINDKLQTIGDYVFRGNDALTQIAIPNCVTTIGQYIFAHCDSLKDVTLGTGLTKIPSYAFNLCPALEKIVLPYRIATVESNAFTNCTKLTEITIPRGTTSISTSAFSYPDRLTIYGISGTYAETYANQIGANFVNREINATEVTLNTTELSMIKGAKYTLIFNVTPSDFTDVVTWQSSNTDIITVDDAGVITAKAVGTASVRVTIGDKMATCAVTVVQPVTSISINKSSLSLDAFEEYTLTATVYPSNAADSSVEWTTSDESVATVSQTGKVTSISKGTAVITVTARDGSGKYGTCNVTVTSDGERCTKYSQLESDHNYADNTNKIWMYRYDGAKTLDVTFDDQTAIDEYGDFIYIYDGEGKEIKKATGTELAGQTIRITGDTVKIKLVSNGAVTSWGFKVSRLAVDGTALNPEDETPEEKPDDPSEEPSTEQPSEEPTTEPETENPSEEPSTEPSTENPSDEPTTEHSPETPSEEPSDPES
ncbi:MAG: leucine-rich repeat protein, partial [Lachnospiraceae bacterium]|nr:leucine-rich repeat protein [Lachnospiraceae bacterium]